MTEWETVKGVGFLKEIGLKSGQTVLDFGCGVGHYTVPAANVIGNKGIVYAVDKEQQAVNELKRKAKVDNLKNVKVMEASGQTKLSLESETVDVVLFYDVLHYLGKRNRKRLYQEASRVLKQDGLLSVYPKHTLEDDPIQEFSSLSVSDVKQEIENSSFVFEQKFCDLISHGDGLNQGCVWNFRKLAVEDAPALIL
ncbi:MAG: class I SAM-dependent methyltransferase [Sedimentisphaerales bacterium]|nr:class I SAM-dependent methyltransferase [Sedimentisphaerales bacterium]